MSVGTIILIILVLILLGGLSGVGGGPFYGTGYYGGGGLGLIVVILLVLVLVGRICRRPRTPSRAVSEPPGSLDGGGYALGQSDGLITPALRIRSNASLKYCCACSSGQLFRRWVCRRRCGSGGRVRRRYRSSKSISGLR